MTVYDRLDSGDFCFTSNINILVFLVLHYTVQVKKVPI